MGSQHNHTETKAERYNQQRFLTHQFAAFFQQDRNQVNTDHKPQYKEEQQLRYAAQHFRTLKIMADCHGGQHNHQDDSQNIFQNQNAEHQTRKLFLAHAQIIKSLIYNSSRRHGDHTAQKDAVHPLPSERRAYRYAQ